MAHLQLVKKDVANKMREIGIEGEKVTHAKAGAYLDLALQSIMEVLEETSNHPVGEGERTVSRLSLVNFGTYEVRRTKLRNQYNPKEKKTMLAPPRNKLLFKPGKMFSDSIL